ncbi:MAG TPA: glycosyltransferase family 1 protein [Vicinamibacterales bacterium]|nr:glycosyltransferase family 1 protein [Vicinamibacterales bacterium]
MNIGVSAWRLYGQRLGIGRYIEYLLKYWNVMLAPSDRVTLYVHEPFDPSALNLSDAFTTRLVRPKLTNALWENLLLPRAAADVDVLLGPSYTLPVLYRRPSVVVVHSVDEGQPGAHAWWHKLTYTQKYRLSARRADKVIVSSHSTAERVHTFYGIPRDRLEVIWHGADEAFKPIEDEELLRQTRIRYFGDNRPYILFVGGLSTRRNVPMLMEAFSRLRRRDKIPHGLLLVGSNRGHIPLAELTARLDLAGSVVQTDGAFREHRELVSIYNAADLFVLPSASEGFSLTLAEALSCGTPVVTVNRASLGEVAYGYAMTIEDPDLEALSDAMRRVLTDPDLRRTLRLKGLERARDLRWDRTARRTLDVLREAAAQ